MTSKKNVQPALSLDMDRIDTVSIGEDEQSMESYEELEASNSAGTT